MFFFWWFFFVFELGARVPIRNGKSSLVWCVNRIEESRMTFGKHHKYYQSCGSDVVYVFRSWTSIYLHSWIVIFPLWENGSEYNFWVENTSTFSSYWLPVRKSCSDLPVTKKGKKVFKTTAFQCHQCFSDRLLLMLARRAKWLERRATQVFC